MGVKMAKFDICFSSQEDNLGGNISFESNDNSDLLKSIISILENSNFPLLTTLAISQRQSFEKKERNKL